MLSAKDVSVMRGNRRVLHGASLDLAPGYRVALTGRSGCGKTTFLRVLCGLLQPDSGRVTLDGRDLFSDGTSTSRHEFRPWPAVTLVFQELALLPTLNARDNCTLGLDSGASSDYMHDLARSLEVEHCLHRRVHELSQGERQRIAIIRGLVRLPRYVLLDEPTSALDLESSLLLAETLCKVAKEQGTAILVVTHDLTFAKACAMRILSLTTGTISAEVPSPHAEREAGLG